MTKIIKESLSNNIILDNAEINSNLLSLGEFSSDNIFIKKYILKKNEEEENKEGNKIEINKYMATLKIERAEYSGMLNDKYQREGYGLEIFKNGDKYLGQYD